MKNGFRVLNLLNQDFYFENFWDKNFIPYLCGENVFHVFKSLKY